MPEGITLQLLCRIHLRSRSYPLQWLRTRLRGYIYGGQLENITNTPFRSEQYPMYSNDGNWLVYSIEEQGSLGLDIALRNVQTEWDTVIYTGAYDQKDFSWCADDTMFAYESPLGITSNIYYYSNFTNGFR